jgi:hypothetical protein
MVSIICACPLTIGSAYLIGGLIPLVPYMLTDTIAAALRISILTTSVDGWAGSDSPAVLELREHVEALASADLPLGFGRD